VSVKQNCSASWQCKGHLVFENGSTCLQRLSFGGPSPTQSNFWNEGWLNKLKIVLSAAAVLVAVVVVKEEEEKDYISIVFFRARPKLEPKGAPVRNLLSFVLYV